MRNQRLGVTDCAVNRDDFDNLLQKYLLAESLGANFAPLRSTLLQPFAAVSLSHVYEPLLQPDVIVPVRGPEMPMPCQLITYAVGETSARIQDGQLRDLWLAAHLWSQEPRVIVGRFLSRSTNWHRQIFLLCISPTFPRFLL